MSKDKSDKYINFERELVNDNLGLDFDFEIVRISEDEDVKAYYIDDGASYIMFEYKDGTKHQYPTEESRKGLYIINVDYQNDKKTHLIFTYNNGTRDEYIIHKNKEGRYIIFEPFFHQKDNALHFSQRYLIENQEQIEDILHKKKNDYSFGYFIFLTEIDFRNRKFNCFNHDSKMENIFNFSNFIFAKPVYFRDIEFQERVVFSEVWFLDFVLFQQVVFKSRFDINAYFMNGIFVRQTRFAGSVNIGGSHFMYLGKNDSILRYDKNDINALNRAQKYVLRNNIMFKNVIFQKDLLLTNIKCFQSLCFDGVKFNQSLFFERCSISKDLSIISSNIAENLVFNYVKGGFEIDIIVSHINNMYHNNTDIYKAKNRYTFTVFKNLASKQNDYISALNFHTKEYAQHYEELKIWNNEIQIDNRLKAFYKKTTWSIRNFNKIQKVDLLILWFEKHVSNFGTNASLSMLWLVLVLSLYALLDIIIYPEIRFSEIILSWLPLLNVYFIKDVLLSEEAKTSYQWWYLLLQLLKIIIIPILLYEIIKSFRKFSRRL